MAITDRMKEIDRQINLLSQERRQLLMNEINAFQDEHRHNVGRCFRTPSGRCAIVTGVPRIDRTRDLGISFNRHQFPALILERIADEEAVIPFSADTIFSRNGTDFGGDPILGCTNYQEISFDEFISEFDKRVDALRAVISSAAKQEET